MATIKLTKKSLEPPAKVPAGVYEFRFDGFSPTMSKGNPAEGKDPSVNLNPKLTIINSNDPNANQKSIKDFLNVNAPWIIRDFVHSVGEQLIDDGNGNMDIPGDFIGVDVSPNDPTKWNYQGPLLGKMGKLELAEVPGTKPGQTFINVKRYFCAVPGCQEQHSDNLIRAK